MTLQIGILLAFLCAVASNLGFFFKHRGACACSKVEVKHPLRSAKALWTSKWFAIGMLVGGGGWALHVAEISFAPLSVVQVVLSGGVVLIAVIADRMFGFSVGRPGIAGLASPALIVAGCASAAAFYASARSLQDGEAVEVIAITGTAANIAGIAGGIIVFGDPMPGTALGIALQAIAFVLVVVASALTPAQVRSAERAATTA